MFGPDDNDLVLSTDPSPRVPFRISAGFLAAFGLLACVAALVMGLVGDFWELFWRVGLSGLMTALIFGWLAIKGRAFGVKPPSGGPPPGPAGP